MSFDFNIAIRKGSIPSAADVNSVLSGHEVPARILLPKSGPVGPDERGVLEVEYAGDRFLYVVEEAILDADNVYAEDFSDPDGELLSDNGEMRITLHDATDEPRPIRLKDDLERLGANGVSFDEGDIVLTLSSPFNQKAVFGLVNIVAGILKCSDGYAFEFQNDFHGGSNRFADLIASADPSKLR